MLCDQFTEFRQHRVYQTLPPPLREAMNVVSIGVEKSPRFILDRAATMMVQNITMQSPRAFLSALTVCKLPYPSMWVEFAFKDRADWLEDASKKGLSLSVHEDASAPSRLGYLIKALDEHVFSVQQVWTHVPPLVDMSKKVLVINIDPAFDATKSARFERALASFDPPEVRKKVGIKSEADARAAAEMECRIASVVPSYLERLWMMGDDAYRAKLDELTRYDLAAEWRFVLSLFTVLNSRNIISYGPEESFEKLNRARAKKGKPPLLSHRPITLNLSKVQRNRVGSLGGGEGRASPEAHYVRGHWKLRSTGLFWWSPHRRGDGYDATPRTYHVKG